MVSKLNAINRENIISALTEIDEKGIRAGRHSSTYDLEYNGKLYPPKYVLSLASKYATGSELEPHEFAGGENTEAFETLKKMGFTIVPKKNSFTWVPAHYKISDWLQNYEHNQPELIQTLKDIGVTVFKDLDDGEREIDYLDRYKTNLL